MSIYCLANFWDKTINTTCYAHNRIFLHSYLGKTPCELYFVKRSTIKYLKVFGCKVYILNIRDYLENISPKVDDGLIVGYSLSNRAYRLYNKKFQNWRIFICSIWWV